MVLINPYGFINIFLCGFYGVICNYNITVNLW